jgi:ABC-2 type transport system ATP-binding protein
VFLDEPTTGFDPAARRQSWQLIRGLRALGETILLTTHYMEEAQQLADRVVVIAGGRVIAEGAPDTLGREAEQDAQVAFRLPPKSTRSTFPCPPRRSGSGARSPSTRRVRRTTSRRCSRGRPSAASSSRG